METKIDYDQAKKSYDSICKLGLSLDLTRGKPSSKQLDLSNDLLALSVNQILDSSGSDTRNYGGLDGLPEMKTLFADILEVSTDQTIIGGNSSLTLMYDYLSGACLYGVPGGDKPWAHDNSKKFICPVPGYDRHFEITEHLGFELISIEMTEHGPNMDQVEDIVRGDSSVKGIWCVPKYSNPTGTCYSEETVRRLATMATAASDFRIIWDNAYAEHHLTDKPMKLANIMDACAEANNPNRVIEFASTSKMTYPGAGVAAMAGSLENVSDIKKHLSVRSIGPDKINQLRHCHLFPSIDQLRIHMQQHLKLVKPKFDKVIEILSCRLNDQGIATWTQPQGGYFISVDVQQGKAKRVIQLATNAGVALTKAGAPFPRGVDPNDRNIRIAPTFATLKEIEEATEALCACIRLAASE